MIGSVIETDILDVVVIFAALRLENRGLENGKHDGAMMARVGLTGVDQFGFDVHLLHDGAPVATG